MYSLLQEILKHLRQQYYLFPTVQNQYALLILAELSNLRPVQEAWSPPESPIKLRRLHHFLRGKSIEALGPMYVKLRFRC